MKKQTSNFLANLLESGAFTSPASYEQSRLWYLWQENVTDTSYNMVYKLKINGPINANSIEHALHELQERHEILRTSFMVHDDNVMQLVHPRGEINLEHFNLQTKPPLKRNEIATKLINDIALAPFDLSVLPLMRCRLIQLDASESWLVFAMHHIIGDGWSHAVLTRDFCSFYNNSFFNHKKCSVLPSLKMQYSDFSEWQKASSTLKKLKSDTVTWVEKIEDVPELKLPKNHAASNEDALGLASFSIESKLCSELRRVARQKNLTISALFLSAYQSTLSRLSSQREFLMGMVVANRELPEFEDLIGFFANTLAIDARVSLNTPPIERAKYTHSKLIELQNYRGLPFNDVVNLLRRNKGETSKININALFVLQNSPFQEIELNRCKISTDKIRVGRAKFPLTLFVTEQPNRFSFDIEYSSASHSNAFIKVFQKLFLENLMLFNRQRDFPVLSQEKLAGENQLDWLKSSIVARIWSKAKLQPTQVALIDGDSAWSYQQLIDASEAISSYLINYGLVKGDVVATYLPRGRTLYAAILGILRCGMIWVPIDAETPTEYRDKIIDSCSPASILNNESFLNELISHYTTDELDLAFPLPEDIAIIFYTSGSTGEPKGVTTRHNGIANVSCWIADELNLTSDSRGVWKTTISFDAVCRELFPVLVGGGQLIVGPKHAERDMYLLAKTIKTHKVTVLHCVPSQLALLVEEEEFAGTLNTIMSGGEPLGVKLAKRVLDKGVTLYNVYGPTETTIDVSYHKVSSSIVHSIPIGKPIPNVSIYITQNGKVVERGCIGEIFIQGAQVAAGYLHETAQSGFSHLEAVGIGYYTGDFGYISENDEIYYCGRGDRQVKLNGVRTEPRAIEDAFEQSRHVQNAHVVSYSTNELVAFVTPSATYPAKKRLRNNKQWEDVFNHSYDEIDYTLSPINNTVGWDCSATKQPIPSEEVLSACQQAADKILRWQPKRILELGCGLGTLSFRLLPAAERFVGVDFSQSAIDYINHHHSKSQWPHAQFLASDINKFSNNQGEVFDAIVLNSVVQYLDSEASLNQLLSKVSKWLSDDGFIFIGDVRDARLDQAFHFWKAYKNSNTSDTCSQVLLNAQIGALNDAELRLAPEYFASWASTNGFNYPLIELKNAFGDNELTKFRLDVTLSNRTNGSDLHTSYSPNEHTNGLVQSELLRMEHYVKAGSSNVDFSDAYLNSDSLVNTPYSLLQLEGGPVAKCCYFSLISPSITRFISVTSNSPLTLKEASQICAQLTQKRKTPDDSKSHDSWKRRDGKHHWQCFLAAREIILEHVESVIPRSSLPTRVIQLPYLPLSRNGKRDNKTLRKLATQFTENAQRTVERPEIGTTEHSIASIFGEFVGASFLLDDNFFFKGGHSLLAAQVRNRIQKTLNHSLSLNLIFEHPTPRSLAAALKMLPGNTSPNTVIRKRPANETIELSNAQKRLWFIESLGTGTAVYNIAHAVRIKGKLDTDVLDNCIATLISRHESMRSTFYNVAGEPKVKLLPNRSIDHIEYWPRNTETRIIDNLVREQNKPFDLSKGPLYRFIYAQVTEYKAIFCFICHHIISDGWSMMIALKEITELYNAHFEKRSPELAPVDINYFDLAFNENKNVTSGKFEPDISKWKHILENAPSRISLPYDFPIPSKRSWSGDKVTFEIPEAVFDLATQFALKNGLTENMVYLATYNLLLSILSSQKDIVIGTVSANRNSVEHENVMGMMVNPIPIRTNFDDSINFEILCEQVRSIFVEAFALQEVPFEKLIERLNVDRNSNYQAVFQVLFAMQNFNRQVFTLKDTDVERIKLPPIGAMFDLSLEITESAGKLYGELEYSSELFLKDTANQFTIKYVQLLKDCLENPQAPLTKIKSTNDTEHSTLLSWSKGAPLPNTSNTIIDLFNTVCLQTPDRTAINIAGHAISYKALKSRVIEVASKLAQNGCRRGDCVALVLVRNIDTVTGYLAAQWLGAAPCYIDPQYPAARVEAMLKASKSKYILKNESSRQLDLDSEICELDLSKPIALSEKAILNSPKCSPNDPAFISFTSGTTGTPKLIVVSHNSLCARLDANTQLFGNFSSEDKLAHCYSFNYDGGLLSLFWPITRGIEIDFFDLDLLGDANALTREIKSKSITIFDSIPSIVEEIYHPNYKQRIKTLKLVITGGDACSTSLVQKHFAYSSAVFANQYGPCEAVINATTAIYTLDTIPDKVTIGKPIPGAEIAIVDQQQKMVPIGSEGEIWIGGKYLADKYLNDKQATDDKFIFADFGTGRQRYYKSGDRGRWLNDGNIEFLGRADRQIQKNGMRLELDEVEATLTQHPQVKLCRIPYLKNDSKQIAAFVVPEINAQFTEEVEMQWEKAFDTVYTNANEREKDYTGWTETATGQLIPEAEMAYWLNDTISTLKQFNTNSVLEIGSGLGLIALDLSKKAQKYVATDISKEAVDALKAKKGDRHALHIYQMSWEQILLNFSDQKFELIVVNSVIQYLSSFEEFTKLISGLRQLLKRDGVIYLGDVKHFDYRNSFYKDIIAKRYNHSPTLEVEQKLLFEMERNDDELYVSPTGLQYIVNSYFKGLSLFLRHKPSLFTNELMTYRFDAIIGSKTLETPAQSVIDWSPDMLKALRSGKVKPKMQPLRFTNVPYTNLSDTGIAVRSSEIYKLIRFSQKHQLRISIGAANHNGKCTVSLCDSAREPYYLANITVDDGSIFSNLPKFGNAARLLSQKLSGYLESCLPQHMVPSSILVLKNLPTKLGGKVDDKLLNALVDLESRRESSEETHDIRVALLKDIWCRLLDVSSVSYSDDFFSLGGHSLLAIRFVAAIKRELSVELPPLKVFELRRFGSISRAIFEITKVHTLSHEEEKNVAATIAMKVQDSIFKRLQAQPAPQSIITLVIHSQKTMDIDKLKQSFEKLSKLHPLMQFMSSPENNGENYDFTQIHSESTFNKIIKLRHIDKTSLISVSVLNQKGQTTQIVIQFNALAFDGRSIEVILQDWLKLYSTEEEATKLDQQLITCETTVSRNVYSYTKRLVREASSTQTEDILQLKLILNESDKSSLDKAASELNVTVPALLLGKLAWAYNSIFSDKLLSIECSVDSRAKLSNDWARAIGPFSLDMPIHFQKFEDVEDYQIQAAESIANLMTETSVSNLPEQIAPLSFSYRLRSTKAPLTLGDGISFKNSSSPLWNNAKLSVEQHKRELVLKLRYNPHAITPVQATQLINLVASNGEN